MASNNLPHMINNDSFYSQFNFFPSIASQYGIPVKRQPSIDHVPSVFSESSTDSLSSPSWNTANSIQLPVQSFGEEDSDSTSISSSLMKSSKKIHKPAQEAFKSAAVANRRPNRRRNPWTPQEDAQLLELMKKHGQCWAIISSSLPGRTGKQVRDRYVNNLAPGIECGNWTPEEDDLVERLRNEKGNKWSYIASNLSGRSEAQVKNRYYSFILKKKNAQASNNQAYSSQKGSEASNSPIFSPEVELIGEPEHIGTEFSFGDSKSEALVPVCPLINSEGFGKSQILSNVTVPVSTTPDDDSISYGNVIRIPFFPGSMGVQEKLANPLSLTSHQSSDKSSVVQCNQPESPMDFILEEEVDNLLENVVSCFENAESDDIGIFFADGLRKEESEVQVCSEFEFQPSQREVDLRKRKAYLEMMLAETIKEMQNF